MITIEGKNNKEPPLFIFLYVNIIGIFVIFVDSVLYPGDPHNLMQVSILPQGVKRYAIIEETEQK